MNQKTITLIVGVAVAGILFYLSETNTTLALLAIAGVIYLAWGRKLIPA